MDHKPRAFQRVYLTFYLRMFVDEKFIGFLIDVSEDGIMLMSESLMQNNIEYELKLKLPSSLEWKNKISDKKFVLFKAKCVWSKPDDLDDDFYLSGYEFTDIDDTNKQIIHEIIEEYKLQ